MTAGCKVFGMALGSSSDVPDAARSVFSVVSNPDVTKKTLFNGTHSDN